MTLLILAILAAVATLGLGLLIELASMMAPDGRRMSHWPTIIVAGVAALLLAAWWSGW